MIRYELAKIPSSWVLMPISPLSIEKEPSIDNPTPKNRSKMYKLSIVVILILIISFVHSSSNEGTDKIINTSNIDINGNINGNINEEVTTKLGSYSLIYTYKHDIHSFTQGLALWDGKVKKLDIDSGDRRTTTNIDEMLVVESAGLYGKSDLRIVKPSTGEVRGREEGCREATAATNSFCSSLHSLPSNFPAP